VIIPGDPGEVKKFEALVGMLFKPTSMSLPAVGAITKRDNGILI